MQRFAAAPWTDAGEERRSFGDVAEYGRLYGRESRRRSRRIGHCTVSFINLFTGIFGRYVRFDATRVPWKTSSENRPSEVAVKR